MGKKEEEKAKLEAKKARQANKQQKANSKRLKVSGVIDIEMLPYTAM